MPQGGRLQGGDAEQPSGEVPVEVHLLDDEEQLEFLRWRRDHEVMEEAQGAGYAMETLTFTLTFTFTFTFAFTFTRTRNRTRTRTLPFTLTQATPWRPTTCATASTASASLCGSHRVSSATARPWR